MIHQVVSVLHEDQAGTAYEVTLAELEEMVRQRTQPLARERGVGFTAAVRADDALPNRVANLVALILINLCENAVQATPRGGTVMLTLGRDSLWPVGGPASGPEGARLRCEVRDEGGGFPADTPLFMPCRSLKEGGTGIGLALCKQLANHLGAELELAASTAAGCVFTLSLAVRPARPCRPATRESAINCRLTRL